VAEDQLDDIDSFESAPAVAETSEAPPQYGVGPFSIREVSLGGVWLVAFVVSFFSLNPVRFDSVWTSGLTWILTIGLPTVAVFLVILRRLSPEGIRRVGSLGIDQFASVAFSVSAVVWLGYVWETVAFVADGGPWVRSWVMWVEFVLMIIGVVLTVFAPFIPVLGDDFRHRPEIVAHRNARPLRPIVARPAPAPRPAAQQPAPAPEAQNAYAPPAYGEPARSTAEYGLPYGEESASDASWAPTDDRVAAVAYDPSSQQTSAQQTSAHQTSALQTGALQTGALQTGASQPEPIRHQAFWALVPEERDVVDEAGTPIFRIGPDAWALVIEDRGDAFVMRHEDGRIGYLHDISGVTRG
jgi:hypothetical protein